MREMPNGLRRSAREAPISTMGIVLLLAAGIFLFPVEDMMRLLTGGYGLDEELAGMLAVRLVFSFVVIKLIFDFGFEGLLGARGVLRGLPFVLPFLLVAVNNFPIIALATGNAVVTQAPATVALYVAMCLSVGILEELIFRGIVFPLCLIRLNGKKRALFWSVVLSSAIFGGMHLINLLGGNIGGTFLQVGYSCLIGGMCAAVTYYTASIYPAIFLHFIYNTGGLLLRYVGDGFQWDTATVVITAALGVGAFLFAFFTLFGASEKRLCDVLDLGDGKTYKEIE